MTETKEKEEKLVTMDEIFEKAAILENTIKSYYSLLKLGVKLLPETLIKRNSVSITIDGEQWVCMGTREEMLKKIVSINDLISARIETLMDCTQYIETYNFLPNNYERISLEFFIKGVVKKRFVVDYYKDGQSLRQDGATLRFAILCSLSDNMNSTACAPHEKKECWLCFMKRFGEKMVKEGN